VTARSIVGRLTRPQVTRIAACLLATVACHSGDTLLLSSAEPAVYLVLSREPEFDSPALEPIDSALFALVVTMGSPEFSPYRSVDSFSMRRASDGREFDWTSVRREDGARPFGNGLLQANTGNWRLPWIGAGTRMGRDSLKAREMYEIELLSDGRTITGQTQLPEVPALSFEHLDGVTRVHWPRDPVAAAYWVIAETDMPGALLTEDTLYVLRRNASLEDQPDPPFIRVIAIERNLLAMILDSTRRQSGLVGANGVFGAISSAWLPIPGIP